MVAVPCVRSIERVRWEQIGESVASFTCGASSALWRFSLTRPISVNQSLAAPVGHARRCRRLWCFPVRLRTLDLVRWSSLSRRHGLSESGLEGIRNAQVIGSPRLRSLFLVFARCGGASGC